MFSKFIITMEIIFDCKFAELVHFIFLLFYLIFSCLSLFFVARIRQFCGDNLLGIIYSLFVVKISYFVGR